MKKLKPYMSPLQAIRAIHRQKSPLLFLGDCMRLVEQIPDNSVDLTLTSPPYCIGKEYDNSTSLDDFIAEQEAILPEIARITKDGGSICWQVGYHVTNGRAFPLDYFVFDVMNRIEGFALRNRIIWTYGHGVHARTRFSGRHEMILWFTKGTSYSFDLDSVREPQKYPGKKKYSGPRRGEFSGNPNGKNPSDVWSIPNVKAKHVEKLNHPCQFPVGLANRLVRALSPQNGLVFDPYMGAASAGVSALINRRRFLGAEINKKYMKIAIRRLAAAANGTVAYRSAEQPILTPPPGFAVSTKPEHFAELSHDR